MTRYPIDLNRQHKHIHAVPLVHGGTHPSGERISFTNYYMELNGRPFFGICGEFHYSRYPEREWDAEILKMKLGGVNIVSSYIFWIHHEEEEGHFRWDGERNLRSFVELCAKHGLYVIVRVGPFAHGECRNGGLPDWLYGRPFELRSNDEGYLRYARRLYGEIGRQLRGQFYQDGGPIIAVQLENEFMHAAAPWEVIPKQSHEWVSSGSGGVEHMRVLKQLARESGLEAPFYTSTGWGGAPVLVGEVLPLYGGYAFCPWNIDEQRRVHAPTTEYLFQNYHDNDASCIEFAPPYPPEAYPFACCEMGGGMQVWYRYRFVVPPISVESMALHKIAGGCNFVGYYMFHGGSNPIGLHGYLNEHVAPKISYDFQAPLGEFGQVRDSYRALKLLHMFLTEFASLLCPMATVLPASNCAITPEDTKTLRFAARVRDGAGFVFLNNYQDHVEMRDHHDLQLALEIDDAIITLPQHGGLTLKHDVCAILPFNIDLNGARLTYATTQLVTRLEHAGATIYIFFAPEGMDGEYCFERDSLVDLTVECGEIEKDDRRMYVSVEPGKRCLMHMKTVSGDIVTICTLTRRQALQLWKVDVWGQERLILSDATLLADNGMLELSSTGNPEICLSMFPAVEGLFGPDGRLEDAADGLFMDYCVSLPAQQIPFSVTQVSAAKAVVRLSPDAFRGVADITLAIRYRGDVGYAAIDGRLISDNFANGAPWEIGLRRFEPRILERDIDLYIAPLREGQVVASDSSMAVQQTFVGQEIAQIDSIAAIPHYQVRITQRPTRA
jgi:Glycosyl hydrolases family 35/Beta-galactosidase, domain 2